MATATVSEQGRVVIPSDIRHRLGITPGCQLDFSLEGNTIRVTLQRCIPPTRAEDGFGLLVCDKPSTRRLSDFDVARFTHGTKVTSG